MKINKTKVKITKSIENLKTQYHDYNKYKLSEVAIEIKLTKKQYEEKNNCIYIPKIGTSDVKFNLNSLTLKHQNYFQITLNPIIVKAEYLAMFYNSKLGKLILDSLFTGNPIRFISKQNIQDSLVAIPSIKEQTKLIEANNTLTDAQNALDYIKSELSINPRNISILKTLRQLFISFNQLSEEDLIRDLILTGENKYVEFKETFSKNLKTNSKDDNIIKSSLKTIVAFLNTDGGRLLIGVSDAGEIKGIEEDFYNSNDKYLLNFKNHINSKIGPNFYKFIKYDLISVSGKLLLVVECNPSQYPCFYNDKEFYVRTNPATDKLEGRQQMDYINSHFK